MAERIYSRGVTPISDPIHGTIRFTVLEREIIDSLYFQRLHFVLQNSTTYAAYPSNKTSRFIHSLGVAHLAGEMFISAVSQAKEETLRHFAEEAGQFIQKHFIKTVLRFQNKSDKYARDLESGWTKTIRGRSGFLHAPSLSGFGEPVDNTQAFAGLKLQFIVETLWQATRIAGLVHDLGHLPMSHSFEHALTQVGPMFDLYPNLNGVDVARRREQYDRIVDNDDVSDEEDLMERYSDTLKQYFAVDDKDIADFMSKIAVHERRTLYTFDRIQQDDHYGLPAPISDYRNLVFQFAGLILFGSVADRVKTTAMHKKFSEVNAVLRVLKSIVASDGVDADRLDYTIRDGVACGSPIGTFDVARVVSNAILARREDASFRITFYERALSGIEQFFQERHDGYKYLIYHRTSSRSEACLQELIARLIHYAFVYPESKIASILDDFGIIVRSEGEITGLVPMRREELQDLDDTALKAAATLIGRKMGNSAAESEQLRWPIRSLVRAVFHRDFGDLYSPLKTVEPRERMQRILGDRYKQDDFKKVRERMADTKASAEYAVRLCKETLDEFKGKVICMVQFQKPKVFVPATVGSPEELLLMRPNGTLRAVQDASEYLHGMPGMNATGFNLRIHFLSECDDKRGLKENRDIIAAVEDFLDTRLSEYYLSILDGPNKLEGKTHGA